MDQREEDRDSAAAVPSLAEQLRGRLRRPRAAMPAARAQWLRAGLGLLMATLALVGVVAGLLGRHARRQAVAMGDAVAQAGMARAADRDAAALFVTPSLGEQLAAVGRRLPPGTKLALAARDGAGRLSVAIDSADPDALRETLKADPWFAGFHERGQTIGDQGAIRVTFERLP